MLHFFKIPIKNKRAYGGNQGRGTSLKSTHACNQEHTHTSTLVAHDIILSYQGDYLGDLKNA